MTERPAGTKLCRQTEHRTLPVQRAELPDAAAVRATIPDIGCRPSGPSAMGSAVLHARQFLPVFFRDRGG